MMDRRLGEGSFSKVQLAKHLILGKEVALKMIKLDKIKDPYVRKNLHREAEILSQLSHPNIISSSHLISSHLSSLPVSSRHLSTPHEFSISSCLIISSA